jgi:type II secretory pathway component PulK
MKNERGIALAVVLLATILCAGGTIAMVVMTTGSSQRARGYRERLQAQYAAEAGLVWAMQQLWRDNDYCNQADPADPPAINGMTVDIRVKNPTDCGTKTVALQARVAY